MELETDHIPRALETITDVHSSVSFIVSEPSNARGPDRFEAERQALATLDHPNIAKVLDAGTTDAGRPFFFMERAQGMPLTQFCEACQLAIAGRLTLFRQICLAIAYAHERGIVHRNLKPNNILVDVLDGRPVAKVVDLELAKAVNAVAFTEHSALSALGTMAGTPLYMAPEQAGPNARDADARTDTYALGAILFELLTGTTPIDPEIFKNATFGEILQAIRENRSPAPSGRLEGSDSLQRLPATRRVELDELGPFVRLELDRIVMKALAKEPDQRYQSALALARDLEQIPIHDGGARRTSTADRRSRMSVGRRERQLISAALVLAAAAIGAMSICWPAGVQVVRRPATEPPQAGAPDDAAPLHNIVGASHFAVVQPLADGNGLRFPEDTPVTRWSEEEPTVSANRVSIDNFIFHPRTLQVPAGTKVVWVNADGVPHTVRSAGDLFRSEALDSDDEFERVFSERGTYEYYCELHPDMTGTIIVK